MQVWTLIVAGLAVVATLVSAYLLRRTSKGTVEAADKAAHASQMSASAAQRSADASARSVEVARTAAAESEQRSRREEVLRNVRWASELAVSADPDKARLGVMQLTAHGLGE